MVRTCIQEGMQEYGAHLHARRDAKTWCAPTCKKGCKNVARTCVQKGGRDLRVAGEQRCCLWTAQPYQDHSHTPAVHTAPSVPQLNAPPVLARLLAQYLKILVNSCSQELSQRVIFVIR